jgi:uncharacterized protein (TIGR00730 family)
VIKRVCVFCASSRKSPKSYMQDAANLGKILAQNNIEIVYGGGSIGLMGAMADAALKLDGSVVGIIPEFMVEMEWAHPGVRNMIVVETMHERKFKMVENTDAIIALPGGSGTFEELLEVITSKRLGLYTSPIVIVNLNGFYDPLIAQFERSIKDQLMDLRHQDMWTVISNSSEVLPAIQNTDEWPDNAIKFAAV